MDEDEIELEFSVKTAAQKKKEKKERQKQKKQVVSQNRVTHLPSQLVIYKVIKSCRIRRNQRKPIQN